MTDAVILISGILAASFLVGVGLELGRRAASKRESGQQTIQIPPGAAVRVENITGRE